MRRTVVYFDGVSLYHRLRDKNSDKSVHGWLKYMWLDPLRLASSFIEGKPERSDCEIIAVEYFTVHRHKDDFICYFKVLDDLKRKFPNIFRLHYGKRTTKPFKCEQGTACRSPKGCGSTISIPHDIQYKEHLIATLVRDAIDNRFDVAYLVAADDDYTPVVKTIRESRPGKEIIIALPPMAKATSLVTSASASLEIYKKLLKKSRLPYEVRLSDGTAQYCPPSWRMPLESLVHWIFGIIGIE